MNEMMLLSSSSKAAPVGCRRVAGGRRTVVTRRVQRDNVQYRRVRGIETVKALPDAKLLKQAAGVAKDAVESAAALVPESVPRPAAKGLVSVAFAMVVVFTVKSIFSTALTAILLGGAGWAMMNFTSSNDDSGRGRGDDGSTGDRGQGDEDDPLEEARRIMSKYK